MNIVKISLKLIVSLFILGAIIVFSTKLFNKVVLSSQSPDVMVTFVELFFPPNDLYLPAILTKYKMNDEMIDSELIFTPKYNGLYVLRIVVDEKIYFSTSELNIYYEGYCKKNNEIVKFTSNKLNAKFHAEYGSGFSLFDIDIPDIQALDAPVECHVKLKANNETMKGQVIQLVISRKSSI